MRLLNLLRHRGVFLTFHQTLPISSSHTIRVSSSLYFFCTKTSEDLIKKNLEGLRDERNCLSYRIEKLPRGQPVGSAFQSWMGEGLPVQRGDIFHAINRLRKLNLNKRALEVSLFLLILLLRFSLVSRNLLKRKAISDVIVS